jgi:transcriptional regulator with XRE-family HTH domain
VGPNPNSVVERRRLRAELRRAREDVELTQEQVAAEMDWSLSKIIRIEAGSVGVSTNDLTALLRLYRVSSPDQVRQLIDSAKIARQPSWWSKFRDAVPPTFFHFLEYEAVATVIRQYEALSVPGLLQTEAYARTVISQYKGNLPAKLAKDRLEVRMTRQQLLEQPSPPILHFIIDEAAIQRLAGDESVRDEQLAKLIAVAKRSTVTIEILPFTAGLHRGMGENFAILEFKDAADDDVLYFEGARDELFSHSQADEISLYREMFEQLRAISLSKRATLDYLRKMAARD